MSKNIRKYRAEYFDCTDGIEFQEQLCSFFNSGWDFIQFIPTGDGSDGVIGVVILRQTKWGWTE